jgi:uncharacterized membrane protein YhaH (DUF805 family)
MDWAYLLDSFAGRISRKPFWIAFGIIGIANLVVYFIAETIDGDRLSAIFDLAFTYPQFAIAAKRGQDRNLPPWLVGVVFALSVLLDLLVVLNLSGSEDEPSMIAVVLSITMMVLGVALLIELGFRRGTVGPNRYGPDPLGLPPATGQS